MLLSEIFLKENLQLPEDIVALIHKDCQPFLHEMGNDLSHLLYRGVSKKSLQRAKPTNIPNLYIVPGYYDNRNPRDTAIEVHIEINKRFVQKFGVPFRNGVFVVGDSGLTGAYGNELAVIIPIGNFKYCWSPKVMDLFSELEDFEFEDDEDADFYDIVDSYQTSGLKQAVSTTSEIMLYCNSCFMYIITDTDNGDNH